jgi:hypothetical protein
VKSEWESRNIRGTEHRENKAWLCYVWDVRAPGDVVIRIWRSASSGTTRSSEAFLTPGSGPNNTSLSGARVRFPEIRELATGAVLIRSHAITEPGVRRQCQHDVYDVVRQRPPVKACEIERSGCTQLVRQGRLNRITEAW